MKDIRVKYYVVPELLLRRLHIFVRYCVIIWMIVGGVLGLTWSVNGEQSTINVTDVQDRHIVSYKESHALVIGISSYTNGWPDLPGVKNDIEEVKAVLDAHGFHVVVEHDLDHIALDQAFGDFISRYGQDTENRLLFYFAGHGHTIKMNYGEELGYIVPANAPDSQRQQPEFQHIAMELHQIEIYARRIQSRHALFVIDAPFSGLLFRGGRRAIPAMITYKTAFPVRQFITSASADEIVPDESIFRKQFVQGLQGDADSNQDGYVTGTELGEFLQATVINHSRNAQHPKYGKIRHPDLDKGDFLFQLPTQPTTAPRQDASPVITSSLDRIEIQQQWEDYLHTMEETFSKIKRYEELDISKRLKVNTWEHFIQTFTEDNPYSDRDEELRKLAKERLAFWKASVDPPE